MDKKDKNWVLTNKDVNSVLKAVKDNLSVIKDKPINIPTLTSGAGLNLGNITIKGNQSHAYKPSNTSGWTYVSGSNTIGTSQGINFTIKPDPEVVKTAIEIAKLLCCWMSVEDRKKIIDVLSEGHEAYTFILQLVKYLKDNMPELLTIEQLDELAKKQEEYIDKA